MAIPFLIDTNIWRYILSDSNYDECLNQIELLIENRNIEILIPQELKEEWDDQKNKAIKEIRDNLKKAKSHLPKTNIQTSLENQIEPIIFKKDRIDKIIESGIKIKKNKNVDSILVSRITAKKPPFHKNPKSFNDCLIYFTAIEYLKKKKINTFYFISNNSDDFSFLPNKEVIHPSLLEKDINIKYYLNITKCIHELKPTFPFLSTNSSIENKNQINVVTKNENILDYLYNLFIELQKVLPFVPTNILCRIAPFKIETIRNNYTYYNSFTLHTNNPDIYSFFDSITISKNIRFKKGAKFKNTKSNIIKLEHLIYALNENLVFNISNINNHNLISIGYSGEYTSNKIFESYRELEWKYVFDQLLIADNKVENLVNQAMLAFEFGFLKKSTDYFYKCYQKAKLEKSFLLEYRISFCLQWVNQFNSSEDISSTEIKELLIELDNNSVSDKIFNLSNATQFEKEIVSEYYQSNILKYYSIEISSIVEKIRNHYQSQLGTSINNNNNYQILICKYAEFECFIERNSIPYRHFTNFLDIVNLFIEGAILSYSLNEYQPNKLNHFDDYILEQIILYGNPEKITTLFNQHIKSGIKYRKTDDVSDCKKRIIYFLENFLEIEANFIKESYLLNSKARIYKTLWNIIITLSIIEFDDDFVRACSNFLLPIINGVPDNQKYSLNHFASFIKLKGNIINTKLLKNIYSTCLSNKILHNENLLLAFVSINNGNPPILVNDINSLNSFIEIFFDKCKTCNSIHIDILPQSYKVLNLKNRKSVKKIILEKLHSHFSAQLYYNACLFDIIKYDRYFEKYINLFSPPLQNEINNRHSLRDETFLSGLNELMNLVFKYKIELPKSFIEKFKGVSNYYDWLLDMDNFDYSKFNALWILQYATIHYLEHIFSNEKVKNETKKYLRSNFQPTISNYYAIYENC